MAERFILATRNPGKIREMGEILSRLGVEVSAGEGFAVEVEETGATFAENALLKARAWCEATGLPAIGDDSGLCVDALNGGPGVYSARYGGEGLDDAARCRLLLDSVRGQRSRAAHFSCAIACAFPNGDTLEAEGRCDGMIGYAPIGTGGFGYDPLFRVPAMEKTFAQMTPEEKSAISHRGRALAAFAEKLEAYLTAQREEARREEERAAQEKQLAQLQILERQRQRKEEGRLTGKQRAQLRSLANRLDTILQVGKEGIGEALIQQADSALEARELIKGRVLDNNMEYDARSAAEALAQATRSQVVQVIGSRFVLYRESRTKPRERRIRLVKSGGKRAAL